jgi:hypothetical protein
MSIVFWTLVLVTAVVAVRWGAMIGLIGFIVALMIGAVAVSRLEPPKRDVSAERRLMSESRLSSAREDVSPATEKRALLSARAPTANARGWFPTRP